MLWMTLLYDASHFGFCLDLYFLSMLVFMTELEAIGKNDANICL
jgi:hypothetical protein